MKLKLNLKGSGGFKGFLLAHGEKFVAGLVGLCVVMLLYKAMAVKSLDAKSQPEELTQLASAARTHIETNDAGAVKLVSSDPNTIVENLVDVELTPYSIGAPMNPPLFPEKKKRSDPVLLTIQDVEVHPGFGPIAIIDDNPAAALLLAPPRQPARPQPGNARGRPPRGGGRDTRGGRPGGDRAAAMQRGRRPGGRNPAGARGNRRPVPGMAGRMGGGRRPGMRGNNIDLGATIRPGSSKAELRHWVNVVAKVPIAKQAEAFRRALAQADFFQMSEAIPKYFAYQVQKAEISGDGELKWEDVASVRADRILKMTEDWASQTREVVDRRYIDPQMLLTFPLPPVVGRGWDESATHSDIPLADDFGLADPNAGDKKDDEKDDTDANLFNDIAAGQQLGRGMRGGAGGRAMRPGGRGMAGARRPVPGARGRGMGGDRGRRPVPGMRGGDRGRMGRGDFGGRPMGRGRGGAFGAASEVKHYLFRFFDFKVEPGKEYKYRVRLVLYDPNDNIEPQFLENSVIDRRVAVPTNRKPFRFTDWSEPSPLAVVPFSGRVLAGPVKAASLSRFNDEPSLQALVKQLDKKRGFDAAYEIPIMRRGMIGNRTASVDVYDPNFAQITKVDDYHFLTGAVLLDMHGGRRLSSRNDQLTEPGEVLFLSPAGRLFVRNELDDLKEYQRYRDTLPVKDTAAGDLRAPRGGRPGRGMPPGRVPRR